MSIDPSEAEDLILSKFINDWADTLPVSYQNSSFDPSGTSPGSWVVFRVFNTDPPSGMSPTLGSRGNRRFRRLGEIFFQVFTPLGSGTYQGNQYCKQIRDIFEGERLQTIHFHQASWRQVGSNENNYQFNGRIPFSFDEIK